MQRVLIWTLFVLLGLGVPLQAQIVVPEPGPFGVAVTPKGDKAYVPMFGSYDPWVVGTKVAVIDTATDTVTGTFVADLRSEDVAFTRDGSHAFVSASSGGTVVLVDTATDTPVATISVGTPFATFVFGVSVTPDGKQAYVCTSGGNYDGSEGREHDGVRRALVFQS